MEDLGFGAELTNTYELQFNEDSEDSSGDIDEENANLKAPSKSSVSKVQFKESMFIIKGMTCTNC